MLASPGVYAATAVKRACTRIQSAPAWIGYWIDFVYGARPSSNTNSVSPTLPSCGVSVRSQNVTRIASPAATGAVVGACSCTAHSWLDASLTAKRIASVNGCPVTVMGVAVAAFALSPEILNAAIPAPPSRSTRGTPAMRAFAASWNGFGWLAAADAAAAGGAPVAAGARTGAGGGATGLMQLPPAATHASSKEKSRRDRIMRAA